MPYRNLFLCIVFMGNLLPIMAQPQEIFKIPDGQEVVFNTYSFISPIQGDKIVFQTANVSDLPAQQKAWLRGTSGEVLDSCVRFVGKPCYRSPKVIDGYLFITATWYDTVTAQLFVRLIKTDGTADGTTILKEIPGVCLGGYCPPVFSSIFTMTQVGDKLFFPVYNEDVEWQLWVTNGSSTGTQKVTSLPHGNGQSYEPHDFFEQNGLLYFLYSAPGDVYKSALWQSDGTAAGTIPVDWPGNIPGRNVFRAFKHENELFLVTDSTLTGIPTPFQIWYSNEGPGTASLLSGAFSSTYSDIQFMAIGPDVYIVAGKGIDPEGYWLMKYDISTQNLIDLLPVEWAGGPFAYADNHTFLTITQPESGTEVWETDGTASGTHILSDLCPGPDQWYSRAPENLMGTDSLLYFIGDNCLSGPRILTTVPGSGVLSAPYSPLEHPFIDIQYLQKAETGLYFFAEQLNEGWSLWQLQDAGMYSGTEHIDTEREIKVMPNPVEHGGVVHIHTGNDSTPILIRVQNAFGNTILETKETSILANWPSGMYTIVIYEEKAHVGMVKKLIVF